MIRRRDASHATLNEGIVNATMCIAAQQSEFDQQFVQIQGISADRREALELR